MSRFGVPGLAKSQKFRFLLVGLANTVFGYLFFAGLLLAVGEESYVLTGVVSHLVATTLSFGLNRTYVFGSDGRILLDYLRFQVTYALILALNLALLIAFVEFLRWPVLVAQAVCLCLSQFPVTSGISTFPFAARAERSPRNEQVNSAQ